MLKSSPLPARPRSYVFFPIRVIFHGNWQLAGGHEREADHLLFHSTISIGSRTLRHFLQLCILGNYHIFLIVFTRLFPYEIYHISELLFD